MYKSFSIFLLIFLFSFNLFAQKQIIGKVIRVHDGDTLTLLDANNQQFQIRLAGIDAPELRQEFGEKAKYNLANAVFGKNVSVSFKKTDKYGRIIGKVTYDGVDICLKQIKDGFAWHYKEYEKEQIEADRKLYADAENQARSDEIGLWRQSALAPWEWRAKKSENAAESPTPMPQLSNNPSPNSSTPNSPTNPTAVPNNQIVQKGNQGGCYYINSNGNKTYVDRSRCN